MAARAGSRRRRRTERWLSWTCRTSGTAERERRRRSCRTVARDRCSPSTSGRSALRSRPAESRRTGRSAGRVDERQRTEACPTVHAWCRDAANFYASIMAASPSCGSENLPGTRSAANAAPLWRLPVHRAGHLSLLGERLCGACGGALSSAAVAAPAAAPAQPRPRAPSRLRAVHRSGRVHLALGVARPGENARAPLPLRRSKPAPLNSSTGGRRPRSGARPAAS
jgi:hypothetical protein